MRQLIVRKYVLYSTEFIATLYYYVIQVIFFNGGGAV